MSNELARVDGANMAGLEAALLESDLSKLSQQQRVQYYAKVCESVGLNPITQPFEYLKLNGKLVLYAKRGCTDQLRKIHNVSVTIASREKVDGIYVVTARATTPDGRCDENIGAVPIENLKGENLSNALMKAETKAKRRVTLSICGLSMLDETEAESVPGAAPARQLKPVRSLDDVASAGGETQRPFVDTSATTSSTQPATTTRPVGSTMTSELSDSTETIDAETGEVDPEPVSPSVACPVFQSGADKGKTYMDVSAHKMQALLDNPSWSGKASTVQLEWARFRVAHRAWERRHGINVNEENENG